MVLVVGMTLVRTNMTATERLFTRLQTPACASQYPKVHKHQAISITYHLEPTGEAHVV